MSRLACLLAVACACGGGRAPHTSAPLQRPLAAGDYTASRWIPAAPTYAASARTIRDVQRVVTDFTDSFGLALELGVADVSRVLADLLVVDPMKPDSLASIGVDVDGGIAVFSEAISPTIVVHLSAPDQLAEFFQQQRARGMATTSEMAGTIEIFTTKISKQLWISWAVDGEWLWVHFGLALDRQRGTDWFASSHAPAAPTWGAAFAAAANGPHTRLAGFADVRAVLGMLPADPCTRLLAPVSQVRFSAGGDGKIALDRIVVDVGPAAAVIAAATLPPPEGWDATSRRAGFAAQWNLDVPVVARWAAPCAKAWSLDPAIVESFGVRSVRALVTSFDLDSKLGTGVVALDVTSGRYFKTLLDEIPLRSTFESDATFGPWAGKSLSVPFGPTVEYVLTDRRVLAGIGDGLLARAVGKGPALRAAPVFALDVLPGGLTVDVWRYAFSLVKLREPKRAAERLQRWRELHVTLILEGTQLVFEAAGRRGS